MRITLDIPAEIVAKVRNNPRFIDGGTVPTAPTIKWLWNAAADEILSTVRKVENLAGLPSNIEATSVKVPAAEILAGKRTPPEECEAERAAFLRSHFTTIDVLGSVIDHGAGR